MVKDMSNEGKVLLKIAPKTKKGNVAKVDGPGKGETLEGDATTEDYIIPAGEEGEGTVDNYKKWIVSGTNGPYKVSVKWDVDLGDGIRDKEVIVEGVVRDPEAEEMNAEVEDEVSK